METRLLFRFPQIQWTVHLKAKQMEKVSPSKYIWSYLLCTVFYVVITVVINLYNVSHLQLNYKASFSAAQYET